MEDRTERKYTESGKDIVDAILQDDFHAVNFDVEGVHYCFSGWWLLDIEGPEEGQEEDKIYDSKEEFLNDPIFGGKTLGEVEVENIMVELWP